MDSSPHELKYHVLLVNPPIFLRDALSGRVGCVAYVPISLLRLAASLEAIGVESTIVDYNMLLKCRSGSVHCRIADIDDEVVSTVASRNPLCVGFHASHDQSLPFIAVLAERIKEVNPEAKIILGGVFATFNDHSILTTLPHIDVIVRHEGEQTLAVLVDALKNARTTTNVLRAIRGITFRNEGGHIERSPNQGLIANLSEIPDPAYDRVADLSSYDCVCLDVGRGCPFKCVFCSASVFWGRTQRLLPASAIVKEMKKLRTRYGANNFLLLLDVYAINKRHVQELCDRIGEAGMSDVRWRCQIRIDLVDEDTISALAKAGCGTVLAGIETASMRVQREIGKVMDLEAAERAVKHIVSNGMDIRLSFIVGLPNETEDDITASVRFALRLVRGSQRSTSCFFSLLTIEAGSELAERITSDNIITVPFMDSSYSVLYGERQKAVIQSNPDLFCLRYLRNPTLSYSLLQAVPRFYNATIRLFPHSLETVLENGTGAVQLVKEYMKCCQTRCASNDISAELYELELVKTFPRFLESQYWNTHICASLKTDLSVLTDEILNYSNGIPFIPLTS